MLTEFVFSVEDYAGIGEAALITICVVAVAVHAFFVVSVIAGLLSLAEKADYHSARERSLEKRLNKLEQLSVPTKKAARKCSGKD